MCEEKYDYSENIVINREIKDYEQKISFLEESIQEERKFIYVAFKTKMSFLDLSTIDNEYKYFFLIPYNSYIDTEWSHLSFQTKLDMDRLIDLLVFYDADFPSLDENSIKDYFTVNKIS